MWIISNRDNKVPAMDYDVYRHHLTFQPNSPNGDSKMLIFLLFSLKTADVNPPSAQTLNLR